MFTKDKDNEVGTPVTPPVREKPRESAPSKAKGRIAPSIFSADLTIEGSLKSEGDVQFDGKIEGSIRSRSLTVGEQAVVKGEIVADDVTIRGRIHGSVRARKVHLSSTAHVEGDIFHNALGVETGAFFQGNCRHVEDPLSADTLSDVHKTMSQKQSKPDSDTAAQGPQGNKSRNAAA